MSGTVTRVDRGTRRHYQVTGDEAVDPKAKLVSVTTVLGVINKPALIPWARNQALEKVRLTLEEFMGAAGRGYLSGIDIPALIEEARTRPDEIRDEAGNLGTRAHDLIEKYLRGEEAVVPDDLTQVLISFLSWQKESCITVTMAEQMVYSAKHLYAGTMDAWGIRDGKPVALDWKTSNALYPEAALQVSAYAKAWEEMTGERCERAYVVRFGKTKAEFEVREVADIDASFQAFLAAKTLYEGTKAAAWAKKEKADGG